MAPRENKVNAAVFNIGPPMRTSYSAQRLSNPSATSDRQPVQLKLQQQPQQQQQPLSQPPPQPQPPVQANLLLLDFDSVGNNTGKKIYFTSQKDECAVS